MPPNKSLRNVDFQLIKDFLTDKWLLKNDFFFVKWIIDLIIFEIFFMNLL